ncbi:hypothetical protein NQZ68_007426 [Dissostichus eleginoides]|nr:hypothetical protein NQZ68_007426 [Dissostichus eleginoides]
MLLMESPDRNSTGDIYLFKQELGKAMFQSEVQVQRRGNGEHYELQEKLHAETPQRSGSEIMCPVWIIESSCFKERAGRAENCL